MRSFLLLLVSASLVCGLACSGESVGTGNSPNLPSSTGVDAKFTEQDLAYLRKQNKPIKPDPKDPEVSGDMAGAMRGYKTVKRVSSKLTLAFLNKGFPASGVKEQSLWLADWYRLLQSVSHYRPGEPRDQQKKLCRMIGDKYLAAIKDLSDSSKKALLKAAPEPMSLDYAKVEAEVNDMTK
jgi:hypothetical protein